MDSSTDPSPKQIQSNFEQAVSLSLFTWPALTLAVQNNWGGPDSEDKRAWFSGAIVDHFPDLSTTPDALKLLRTSKPNEDEPDAETVEEVLLQVMLDEFEVNVDDESGFAVAEQIIRLRKLCAKGKFEEVDDLAKKYAVSKGKVVIFQRGKDQEEEDEWEDESSSDDDEDVEMDEAPPLVGSTQPKGDFAPEVDDDGFTTVTRKKR
ncbi:putative pre-rRNA-processing protein TSR2 [Zalerion maritima]|uniref:Pre-rRNA-processing protein TSR2 n=1 Tax=Zalerion maritima TaxID=339359 RepID=A0AAD5WMW4_9PEZI|nr:putative pre-rRNA-processing protein TSR2 [Zalerion maritima]